VYDHDPDDVAVLGWEEFTLQQWESIFFGYRSWAGLRTLGRRWSDLIEAGLGWVVTAYALIFGGFLLLGGRAADLLGRRRMFIAGLALFTAASLACALAANDTFLIIMRGIQGLGAAMVLPAALSIVMNMFGEGAERNKALGLWGAIGARGATVGVLAGGALTRYAGWPCIFYLNVAVGGAALLLALRVVPESRLQGARRACADARHPRVGLISRRRSAAWLMSEPDGTPFHIAVSRSNDAEHSRAPAGPVRDHARYRGRWLHLKCGDAIYA
jgi:MFS family permease